MRNKFYNPKDGNFYFKNEDGGWMCAPCWGHPSAGQCIYAESSRVEDMYSNDGVGKEEYIQALHFVKDIEKNMRIYQTLTINSQTGKSYWQKPHKSIREAISHAEKHTKNLADKYIYDVSEYNNNIELVHTILNKGEAGDLSVTIDIGDKCVECYADTSACSGKFVNRIPAERQEGVNDNKVVGYLCEQCIPKEDV
jgi:hypothetical protein